MIVWILFVVVVALAYANGANDNFKGVATLFGSGTTNYRGALTWATVATLGGSLTAVLLASQLVKTFSGKGLVDDHLVDSAAYVTAVALGAGATVLIATRFGIPVSTTHALMGALVGAGWIAGSTIQLERLWAGFALPLLLSPLLSIFATAVLYPVLHRIRLRLGITESSCLCVGERVVATMEGGDRAAALRQAKQLQVTTGDPVTCKSHYEGRVLGVDALPVLNTLHYGSAGLVSFARGLNDTPKIAALLMVVPILPSNLSFLVIGVVIAMGGLVSARRVAEVVSHRITPLNHGQGFVANAVTAAVVIGASRFGLPVSTTHVSCGALFGMGAATGQGRRRMIMAIVLAWLFTLPVTAIVAGLAYVLISPLV